MRYRRIELLLQVEDARRDVSSATETDMIARYCATTNLPEGQFRAVYAFLGVQTGSRYIAEHLFEHHLWINGDNFSRAPAALAEIMQKLILQYHRVSV